MCPACDSAGPAAAPRLQAIRVMLPVALLVGLDAVQADACRSALDTRARVIAVMDADDAITMLSLHRPKLVVMRTDLFLSQRIILADLTAKVGGRLASVEPAASPASVERLMEGFAAVTFTSVDFEQRSSSGTRAKVRPGAYHLESPRIDRVGGKTKR
jgi:hypothetical protein